METADDGCARVSDDLMLAIAISLSSCARAQTSGAEVLTLDQAIQLAHSNNRDLKQSGLDVNKQREALEEAN
jgi:hypothetical protein